MRVFAFLDLEHPAVAWAVMRGMIASADQVEPAGRQGFVSFMLAGMIKHENNPRIYNESIIESRRLSSFPRQISRLRGVYFFRTREEAESRIDDRHWPDYFIERNPIEFELHYTTEPTIVDANWITHAPLDRHGRLPDDQIDWIQSYWAGSEWDNNPVWELLTNGIAVVLDEGTRRRCAEVLPSYFPDCQILMLISRIASEVGADGGLITPFLHQLDDERLELRYVMQDADFHKPDVIEMMKAHPDAGALGRLMAENETWIMPDFRPYGCTFQLGRQGTARASEILVPSVHTDRDISI